jgi:hypothetical protein
VARLKITTWIALIYLVLLFASAIPGWIPGAAIQVPARFARGLLSKAAIEPGLKVFYRPHEEKWKIRGRCVAVKGDDGTGQLFTLFRTNDLCDNPVGESENYQSTLMVRMADDLLADHFPNWDRQFVHDPPTSTHISEREKGIYLAITDFFCHSKQIERPKPVKKVLLAYRIDRIEYETGKKERRFWVLARANCSHEIEYLEYVGEIAKEPAVAFLENRDW